MLQTGVLLREVEELIQTERQEGPGGELRARVLSLVFLINQLPRSGFSETGLRPTAGHIADLLVDDLASSGDALRRDVPRVLNELVAEDKLQQVEEEYQLQTGAGAEWTRDHRRRLTALFSDASRMVALRDQEIRTSLDSSLGRISVTQGVTKTPRKMSLHYGDLQPEGKDVLPVWVRNGWELSEKQVRELAAGLGPESPLVLVYVPKLQADSLATALAERSAANETLEARANPITDEERAARRAMETRRDTADARVRSAVDERLAASLVLQAGGTPVAQGGLRPSVEAALARAADRLFLRSKDADHVGWSAVLARVHQGSPDALEPVSHTGEVDKHPVCKALLDAVTATGASGASLRGTFESAPYGWPRDALNGALGALVAVGSLRAEENGTPVVTKDISAQRIGKLHFLREGILITLKERLAARALLSAAGVPVTSGEEAAAAPQYLQKLEELARQAGGLAPLPPAPSAQHVTDLRAFSGNELLKQLLAVEAQLKVDAAGWRALADMKAPRQEQLARAERFAAHARASGLREDARRELDAIVQDRRLLVEPDPLAPVVSGLADDLRAALNKVHGRLQQEVGAARAELENDIAWHVLDDGERKSLLAQFRLDTCAAPDGATVDALLRTLDQQPLSSWDDRIAAVAGRTQNARAEAVRLRMPKAVRVTAPSRTITSEAELEAYLGELKAILAGPLLEHGSVII